jgi:hypothetical protein
LHCGDTAKLSAPDDREYGQGTGKDRDTDTDTYTDTDTDTYTDRATLSGIAKAELRLVWLWASLGALHCGMVAILQN